MDRHEKLFQDYLAELTDARAKALEWWGQLLADETRDLGDRDAAQDEAERRWPFGAASHPFVIAVFRKYWVACIELNRLIEDAAEQRAEGDDEGSDDDWGSSDDGAGAEEEEEDEEGEVEPMVFLFEWLSGPRKPLKEFLARLVFVPIADGENG